jgi:hypothetical protein
MIEFEIIQKIKVKTLSEDVIREILIKEIQKQIPEAHVNGIEFIIKRNPTRVELEVDADYATSSLTPPVGLAIPRTASLNKTPAEPVVDKHSESKEEVLKDLVLDNPAIEPEALKPAADIASLFKL